jgi:hypothetical protein
MSSRRLPVDLENHNRSSITPHRTKKDTLSSCLEMSTGHKPPWPHHGSRLPAEWRRSATSTNLQDRGIKKEFKMMRVYMDKRFEEVDKRFEGQRSYVDDRFQQVDDRFQELEVLIKNSRATSGWHDIFPVRTLWWGGSDPYHGVLAWSDHSNSWHGPETNNQAFSPSPSSIVVVHGPAFWPPHPITTYNPLAEPRNRHQTPLHFPSTIASIIYPFTLH